MSPSHGRAGAIMPRYVAPAGTTYAAAVAADSPTWWIRMNETSGTTLHDNTAGGHNATLDLSAYTLNQPGLTSDGDKCVKFLGGGLSSKASVPYGAWMDSTSAMTFECIIQFVGSPTGNHGILTRWQNGGSATIGLLWINVSGSLAFNLVIGGSSRSVDSGVAPAAGTTYHVVGTYDGSTLKIYVNGVLKSSLSVSGAIATGNTDIYAGNYSSGGDLGIVNAYLDECALYVGTALSSTRVSAHYAAL